jgi:hypothetical protein
MKSFLTTTAVILFITALGLGQSGAQTDTSSSGSIGATSPLGAGSLELFARSRQVS